MPYKNVGDARKRVPAMKGMTRKQVETFIAVYNELEKKGESEDSIYAKAIGAANKINKSEQVLIKSTRNDIERMLWNAAEKMNSENDSYYEYGYVSDWDDSVVYISKHRELYRYSYSIQNSEAIIDESTKQRVVVGDIVYVEVNDEEDPQINKSGVILQKFNEDKMIEISPMYIAPNEVDLQGDTMDEVELRKMVDSFNANLAKINKNLNYDHDSNKQLSGVEVIKAWITECDCYIGSSFVPEGQPVIKAKYHDKELWNKRKSGESAGWSIQARARKTRQIVVEVED